ncbi:DUF421 domain-containing protein [Thalassobacillus sp. C254]|uniref:DUF421 domain-containing protein n=1 Tax=Thalassobacillus sp. C254 TaxID=1225341 RepID=UPI0006D09359|nr:YetF domain-containing protein [Thalassobacillus sp. C254]
MFFEDWEGIIRVVIISLCIYPLLIFMLRISGKRTLSKMNMFDFIITIALGSTVATILLNEEVTYAEGVAALAMLIILQFIVTSLSVRVSAVNRLIKAEPRLLYYDGNFNIEAMKKERINKDEIKQAVRTNGQPSLHHVKAVVLETDGSLSVIQGEEEGEALKDVKK